MAAVSGSPSLVEPGAPASAWANRPRVEAFRTQVALEAWTKGAEALSSQWQRDFLAHTASYNRLCTPTESGNALRQLIQSKLLLFTDMRDAPERFFAAHRLLASRILGGFGIRFTVQFNLFAGSILGLGGPEQIEMLDEFQERGDLGCFALTELSAGVLSGFIVETTATYDPELDGFVINTPSRGAAKNWISQGLVADWVVVFAQLSIGGEQKGPHPFLLRMRNAFGELAPGIIVEDMGEKTVANDLDNARLSFDNVFAPRSALLNRFCEVRDGRYAQVGTEPMRIEVIGQRLLTGRLAIAEAAIVGVRAFFVKTRAYADVKLVNSMSGPKPLSQLPQLQVLFARAEKQLRVLERYTASVEARLAMHLRSGSIPEEDLVEAIAVCKVRDIEVATRLLHELEEEVGSYALTADSGFMYKDMLLCCKFAEGDSRILMQKMARDELKRFQRRGQLGALGGMLQLDPVLRRKAVLTFKLARAVLAAPSVREGFETEWEKVYALADAMCDAHIHLRPRGFGRVTETVAAHAHTLGDQMISKL